MRSIHVFTSAASNYLPKVRVLFESIRRFRPDWTLHLALADSDAPEDALAATGVDEIHRLPDLEIPQWRAWSFTHSLIELATGIKPFALKKILSRPDCEAAIYLDPDIAVFSGLDRLKEAFSTADILLTPHLVAPETTQHGVIANEICTAQFGIYNLGFIGVAATPEGRTFAEWWARRLYYFCREDIPSGLYTDQRWIDFVPSFFERVRILRSPTLNVAPWNLSTRDVTGSLRTGFRVNGEPLDFYHFSAIDTLDDEGACGGQAAVAELVGWYRAQSTLTEATAPQWGFDAFEDGESISRAQRLVYRLRGDLQRAFPDPFRAGPGSYQAWWRAEAPNEFAALFASNSHDEEIARLSSALTTGYVDL